MFPGKYVLLQSFLIILSVAAFANDKQLQAGIHINDIDGDSWQMQAFELDKDMSVFIRATGQAPGNRWIAKAWILDAKTRRVVWEMNADNSKRAGSKGKRRFSGSLELAKGQYEAYFGVDASALFSKHNVIGIIDNLFSGFDKSLKKLARDWELEIYPDKKDTSFFHEYSPGEDENTIVQLTDMGDDENEKAGFSLKKEMQVRIYSLGEGIRKNREMYDYGWILNADTHRRVWEANIRYSKPAGGASKNRLFDQVITLPAGNYIVYYTTDDSHSAEDFNQMPPYDPRYWGITLWAVDGNLADVVIGDYQEKQVQPIVQLTKIGDEQLVSKGFELLRGAKVRIYALGEASLFSKRMVDYGWIINAHTREKVWEMKIQNTEHAGGGRKNREEDEIIDLPAGAYIVYYSTDDSHSYDDWNTSPPYDPKMWGITVWPADKNFDYTQVRPYDEQKDPALIVSIVGVGDDEHRRKRFTLDEPAKLCVYAIGEGLRGDDEMADYGWIEDSNGNIVWMMTYNKTRRAGGARKNRVFKGTIELDAGTYTAHFQTDDSHSFEEWNASPPDDPSHWGITIFREKE
ncbi:MAG: hypothetical protein GXO75_05080 [Calditrichaeota bacterium]|nr:hypothetical protein [Calditrichota bacterium]